MSAHHQAVAEPLVAMAALRMSVDPSVELRPRMVHAMLAAAMVTWLAWLEQDDFDALAMFEKALDVLEDGMAKAL
jgi:hypothetical protein